MKTILSKAPLVAIISITCFAACKKAAINAQQGVVMQSKNNPSSTTSQQDSNNMDIKAQVADILLKLNAWDHRDLDAYEIAKSGSIPEIVPSGAVRGYVTSRENELNKLGYEAIWDSGKKQYFAKPKPEASQTSKAADR